MTLADKIATCRRQHGLSQEALAVKLNVSRQAVSKWETGDAEPESGKLIALAQTFGVTVDWLLSGDERFQEETEALPVQTSSGTAVPQLQGKQKQKVLANLRRDYVLYLCCVFLFVFLAIITQFRYDPGFAWTINFTRLSNFFDPITLLSMLIGSMLLLWGSGLLCAAAQAFRFMFSKNEYETCPGKKIVTCRHAVRVALLGCVLGGMLQAVIVTVNCLRSMSLTSDIVVIPVGSTVLALLNTLFYLALALFILLPIERSLKQKQDSVTA